MNGARETAVEAESICSTPFCSHQIISQHQTESERGRKKQRERERELVASGGLCSQISIRLMSPAPGLLPPLLLMLLPREGGAIAEVRLQVATVWSPGQRYT